MRIVQTGAWMFDDTRPLPNDVVAFLDAGDPPIYFGFGSMPVAEGTSAPLSEAARATGRRAIVSRGWGGLAVVDTGPDCIEIDDGLVATAMQRYGLSSKRAAVDLALRRLVGESMSRDEASRIPAQNAVHRPTGPAPITVTSRTSSKSVARWVGSKLMVSP